MNKNTKSILTLIGIAIALFAVVIGSQLALKGIRADLTEKKVYTLSPATRQLLGNMAEPVELKLFFSEKQAQSLAQTRTYVRHLKELISNFQEHSNGKLSFTAVDPEPSSVAEERAIGFGLEGVPAGQRGENIFLGLVGSNQLAQIETIPFLDQEREKSLEYDLGKLIYTLAHPKKPRIGLITTLPMMGGFNAQGKETAPYAVILELRKLFELVPLDATTIEVPEDLEALLVFHPKDLPETTLWAIDQYVMRGGNLVVGVDPLAQTDPGDGMSMGGIRSSEMNLLLNAYGAQMDKTKIVGDYYFAVQGAKPIITALTTDPNANNNDVPMMQNIEQINLLHAGSVEPLKGASTTFTPLLLSSPQAQLLALNAVQFAFNTRNEESLLDGFTPTGDRYAFAAFINGPAKSAFAQKPEGALPEQKHLSSTENIRVAVIADVDMLHDGLWAQTQTFQGSTVVNPMANNGDFVNSLVDTLVGSKGNFENFITATAGGDISKLRNRDRFKRPFTVVEEMLKAGSQDQRAKQAELTDKLNALATQVEALEKKLQADVQISPKDLQRIKRAEDERLQLLRELRSVNLKLNQEIEALGTELKLLNVVRVPLVVLIIGLLFSWVRHRYVTGGAGLGIIAAMVIAMIGLGLSFVQLQANDVATSAEDSGEAFIPDLQKQLANVTQVDIARSTNAPSVVLKNDGEHWRITERGNYLVDPESLHNMLQSVAQAKIVRKTSDNPEFFSRLKLNDDKNSEMRRLIFRAGEKVILDLYVGQRKEYGGQSVTFVRHAGETQTYMVSGTIFPEVLVKPWLNQAVLNIDKALVGTIHIDQGGRHVHIQREGDNLVPKEIPDGREPLYASAGDLVAQGLKDLVASDVWPADQVSELGLDGKLYAVSKFQLVNGITIIATTFSAAPKYYVNFRFEGHPEMSAEAKAQMQQWKKVLEGYLFDIHYNKFQQLSSNIESLLKPQVEPVVKPEAAEPAPSAGGAADSPSAQPTDAPAAEEPAAAPEASE